MGHPHDADAGGHCQVSDHYSDFIKDHLDSLRQKCNNLKACINKLLLEENSLSVLTGSNIKLQKICGLIYQGSTQSSTSNSSSINVNYNISSLTDQCSDTEKSDIRSTIDEHIKEHLTDPGAWSKLKQCRRNEIGDSERSTDVDDICRLAGKKERICIKHSNSKFDVHLTVETFFNNQIRDIRCHCHSLEEADHSHTSSLPVKPLVGGGILGLIILLLIAFLCYRKRRKNKKKKRSPNVIYLPAPGGDTGPIYQEVYNDGGPIPTGVSPPSLPMRYTPHPTTLPRAGMQDDEPSYLEPVELGSSVYKPNLPARPSNRSNQMTAGYALARDPSTFDKPPEYSERPPENENSQEANPYFEPIATPPGTPEEEKQEAPYERAPDVPLEQGNSTDLHNEAKKEALMSPAEGEVGQHEDPQPDRKLGPVPAKRSKKEDREIESHYFTLETVDDEKGIQTEV